MPFLVVYIYQDCHSCISLIEVCSIMAPRDLLQDTVEYNRKVNLARKVLKLKKYPLPTLPLMLRRPMQSGMPANVPVKSGKVIGRRVSPSKANNRLQVSKKPRNTKHKCNHVLYTPMAEVRRNYETVLSWLRPAAIKTSTWYRVSSEFVDELLDSLTISDRTTESQSSLRSIPDLSGLPHTKYRVSPSFIDKMLDNLVISKEALEGYHPSMTFVDNLLNSL